MSRCRRQAARVHTVAEYRARRTLYRALARNLKDRLDIGGEDLVVSITENGDADWSFGHGTAQFLTGELG